MSDIKLVDVSIRDGNQSIWSATGLNTAQTLQIAPVMDRIGLQAIDFTSSTHMGVCVRTHKQNPWTLIRGMRSAAPHTPLQFITTGFRFISWETSDPEFMRLAYRTLVINGISRFALIDPMHDRHALLAGARMIRQEGGEVLAGLTYTISSVHDDEFYASLAGALAASPDVSRLYIKDPTGLLTPERARTLIPAVRARIGTKALELHSHCTIGLAPLTYMTAAELGIDVLHVACGPLANGTSLPDARRVVANLRELGHTVDVHDASLERAAGYFASLADAEGLPAGAPQEYDAAFLRHQLPGGAITTTIRQLEELNLSDRLPAVIEETIRVRAELGYPIMYTMEMQGHLVVSGLAEQGPAARAGVRPGDLILQVAGEPVSGLAHLFRSIWRLGPVGTDVPLTLARGGAQPEVRVRSADRNDFLRKPLRH